MGAIEFHHIGLLTEEPHKGEIAYPSMKLWATSPSRLVVTVEETTR